MEYTIYRALYKTRWDPYQGAIVAADSNDRISDILEEHIRKDRKKAKKINLEILDFSETNFNTDKEGVIVLIGKKSLDWFFLDVPEIKKNTKTQ